MAAIFEGTKEEALRRRLWRRRLPYDEDDEDTPSELFKEKAKAGDRALWDRQTMFGNRYHQASSIDDDLEEEIAVVQTAPTPSNPILNIIKNPLVIGGLVLVVGLLYFKVIKI